jgi:hypothetical protein
VNSLILDWAAGSMGEMINAHTILVRNPESKRTVGRLRRMLQDTAKRILRMYGVGWIRVDGDRDQ